MNIILKPKSVVALAALTAAGALAGIALPHFLMPAGDAPQSAAPIVRHLVNADFEAVGADGISPQGWTLFAPTDDPHTLSFTQREGGGRIGVHQGDHDYEVHTYQILTGLENGVYTLRARVKSVGNGKQIASLRAEMFDSQGSARSAAIPSDAPSFRAIEVRNIAVANGRCKIGFHSKAAAGRWIAFDDVEFVRNP